MVVGRAAPELRPDPFPTARLEFPTELAPVLAANAKKRWIAGEISLSGEHRGGETGAGCAGLGSSVGGTSEGWLGTEGWPVGVRPGVSFGLGALACLQRLF